MSGFDKFYFSSTEPPEPINASNTRRIYFLNRNLPGLRWLCNLNWRKAVKAWGLRGAAAWFEGESRKGQFRVTRWNRPWQHVKPKLGRIV